MFNNLQNLGWGLVGFALIIGIGSVVLFQFGGSVAECGGITDGYWNSTSDNCTDLNASQGMPGTGYNASYVPVNAGWVNTNYLTLQLGEAGLAGWTPAIIAISVGMLIMGAFMIGKGGRRY